MLIANRMTPQEQLSAKHSPDLKTAFKHTARHTGTAFFFHVPRLSYGVLYQKKQRYAHCPPYSEKDRRMTAVDA